MYLFAQPWCGACKRLKADFEANGEALVPISKEFIMVNIYGDDNKMFGVKSALCVCVLGCCSAAESAPVCCTLQQPARYPGRKPCLLRAQKLQNATCRQSMRQTAATSRGSCLQTTPAGSRPRSRTPAPAPSAPPVQVM